LYNTLLGGSSGFHVTTALRDAVSLFATPPCSLVIGQIANHKTNAITPVKAANTTVTAHPKLENVEAAPGEAGDGAAEEEAAAGPLGDCEFCAPLLLLGPRDGAGPPPPTDDRAAGIEDIDA